MGAIDDVTQAMLANPPAQDDQPEATMSPAVANVIGTFAKNAATHAIGSLANLVTTPARIMTPNPYPAGSEEGIEFERTRQQAIQDAAPQLASMVTLGAGAAPAEALGAGETILGAGPIRAYHGSPHDFNAFSMDKIGTGEGAQAYGHGLYFAESEPVAQSYRDALAGSTIDGQPFNPANPLHQAAARIEEQGSRAAAMDEMERRIAADPGDDMHPRVLSMLLHRPEIPPIKPAGGKMYEVQINADPEHFLDWDKPLSQQPQTIQDLASKLPNDVVQAWTQNGAFPHVSGSSLYSTLASKGPTSGMAAGNLSGREVATQALRDAGIPGIKYLDQGSRAAGDGSRNYVVFDDKLIDILRKYGMGSIAALPPTVAALQQQQEQAQ